MPDFLFVPLDSLLKIAFNAKTAVIHLDKLIHRLGNIFLGGKSYKLNRPFVIDLYIDTVQICQPDKEIVLGVLIVFPFCNFLKTFEKCIRKYRFIVRIGTGRNIGKFFRKNIFVCLDHLGGKNRFAGFFRHRIFFFFDIIRAFNTVFVNTRFQKARCYRENKQTALFECIAYRLIKILSGGEKFVIPNSDIAAKIVPVDQSHQFLRENSVFFAVAQEDICIKSILDLFYRLVIEQNRVQVFSELFFVAYFRAVAAIFGKELQIAKLLLIFRAQSAFHH